MRALIYDPFLSTLGGGERYALTIAAGIEGPANVTVAGDIVPERSLLVQRDLPSELNYVRWNDSEFSKRSASFDLAFVVTNRLPPKSRAGRSVAIIQFPFPGVAVRQPLRRMRRGPLLAQYEPLVYSEFVREWCLRRWHVDATVIPPAVPRGVWDPGRKSNTILAVGRFFRGEHTKRQDVLIRAFRYFHRENPTWRLVLAGGADDRRSTRSYVVQLHSLARGLPVEFAIGVPQQRLADLYAEAALFWHATGFGRSRRHPERAEHFGITTVEAMGNGAVPLVYDDGGSAEVVDDDVGCRWRSIEDLVSAASRLASDRAGRDTIAACAYDRSAHFSGERFMKRIRDLASSSG